MKKGQSQIFFGAWKSRSLGFFSGKSQKVYKVPKGSIYNCYQFQLLTCWSLISWSFRGPLGNQGHLGINQYKNFCRLHNGCHFGRCGDLIFTNYPLPGLDVNRSWNQSSDSFKYYVHETLDQANWFKVCSNDRDFLEILSTSGWKELNANMEGSCDALKSINFPLWFTFSSKWSDWPKNVALGSTYEIYNFFNLNLNNSKHSWILADYNDDHVKWIKLLISQI